MLHGTNHRVLVHPQIIASLATPVRRALRWTLSTGLSIGALTRCAKCGVGGRLVGKGRHFDIDAPELTPPTRSRRPIPTTAR